ncbi:MAG: glycosyltransferase family 2 protein [Pyrinomonadaceae bacterium]
MKISAVIITLNEEQNIARAIRSVRWADEVVVVDSGSTDATRQIASELGARVIEQEWLGFGRQKQFAVDAAVYDVIFSLDADEEVTAELSAEIRQLVGHDSISDGYRIPRLAVYLGREIRHGGWYPDLQMRLFDRRKGRWSDDVIHESFKLDKGVTSGQLHNDILHFTCNDISEHARMILERYAPLSARSMYEKGKRTSVVKILAAPVFSFFRDYVLRAGFLDGTQGVMIAGFGAYNVFLKNALLWQMHRATK